MTDLMRYASQLDHHDRQGPNATGLPPVHLWNPPFCGDLDLVIKSDGSWNYQGTPIGRARLVRLFSTVLKREEDDFFLVTPVEKIGIQVEDAPFLAVLCDVEEGPKGQSLTFTTNVGDRVQANNDHPLEFRKRPIGKDYAPYLMVRDGLEAKIARSVFYDLVNLGTVETIAGVEQFGVRSNGMFFPFEGADDVYAGATADKAQGD